jgi:hypothetical protein
VYLRTDTNECRLAVIIFAQVALAFGRECGFDVGFAVRDDDGFYLRTHESATIVVGMAREKACTP